MSQLLGTDGNGPPAIVLNATNQSNLNSKLKSLNSQLDQIKFDTQLETTRVLVQVLGRSSFPFPVDESVTRLLFAPVSNDKRPLSKYGRDVSHAENGQEEIGEPMDNLITNALTDLFRDPFIGRSGMLALDIVQSLDSVYNYSKTLFRSSYTSGNITHQKLRVKGLI